MTREWLTNGGSLFTLFAVRPLCRNPLINNFGQRQAVIGFMYSTVESVLPFVIEVAHKYGVTIFDWQSGTIYRPRE